MRFCPGCKSYCNEHEQWLPIERLLQPAVKADLQARICPECEELLARAAREAVAEGVAEVNRCPYCADVHSFMLDGALLGKQQRRADPEIATYRDWALATRSPSAAVLKSPNCVLMSIVLASGNG